MTRYLLIILCTIMIIPFAGCKKKDSFDPTSKSQDDFIGTWKGTVSTFKNNKLIKEYKEVVIYRQSPDFLSGIIYGQDVLILHEFQFLSGTVYFKIPCNDPTNPTCQNWNLGGYASFSEDGKIDFRISGNECGPFGSEYVDWNGILAKSAVPADSIRYLNFAKTGNTWNYKVTRKNGDTCQIQRQISTNPSTFYFQGTASQNCGWPGASMVLKWNVTPSDFSVTDDSTLCLVPFTFPINAKIGVTYVNLLHSDTTTFTLLDTSILVNTPAGNFSCNRYKYTEHTSLGDSIYTKVAWIWLNNRFGVIRHEVENPAAAGEIKTQVLTSKNF